MGERFYGSFDGLMNYKPNKSGKYFSLKNGEEARVRFLYDDIKEIYSMWVHEFTTPQYPQYATIVCPSQGDGRSENCKWCASGAPRSNKVIVGLYNLESNEIQYWKRAAGYVQQNLIPLIEEVAKLNQPIASQVYKIKRNGESLQTTYTIIPTGQPDGQTKATFGELEDPYDIGIIKEYDPNFELGQNNQRQQNGFNQNNPYGQGNYNQSGNFGGNNLPPATRRTVAFD